MATKKKIYLPSVANIGASSAAGSIGIVDLPLYYNYHKIGFEYLDGASVPQSIIYAPGGTHYDFGGSAGGLLGSITLLINNDAKRYYPLASDLNHANVINGSQYGIQVVNAAAAMRQFLEIFFFEPWRSDKVDKLATIATLTPAFGVNSAQLKFTLASAMPATASLQVYAIVDSPSTTVPANMSKQTKHILWAVAAVLGTLVIYSVFQSVSAGVKDLSGILSGIKNSVTNAISSVTGIFSSDPDSGYTGLTVNEPTGTTVGDNAVRSWGTTDNTPLPGSDAPTIPTAFNTASDGSALPSWSPASFYE